MSFVQNVKYVVVKRALKRTLNSLASKSGLLQ